MNNIIEWILTTLPLLIIYSEQGSPLTIESPGIIKTEEDMIKDITWTLSEAFDTTVDGATLEVYKGYIDDGDLIIGFYGGSPKGCYPFVSDVACITEGRRVGFNITNIRTNNASRYSIEVWLEPFGDNEKNQDAILFIHETPKVPTITGNVGQAGWLFNITCFAESQSLPEEFRNQTTIQYIWSGDYNGAGSSITVGPLYKEDNGKNITCTAKDQGASDRLSINNTVSITVYYSPGKVSLLAMNSSTIEGITDLAMTCTVPDDQQGNPNEYSYYWTHPATTNWINSTESLLIINRDKLNATLHDGQWQCKAGNWIGNTTADSINITVNAMPSTIQQPQNTTILVNQTLSVTCSFRAKPTTNISWVRGVSSSPNTSIIMIDAVNTPDGPYTVTTSFMSWKNTNYNDRRTVGDKYRCEAVNYAGKKTSLTAWLDIHYWPWSVTFVGPGNTSDREDIIESTELVNRTCAADCNPGCIYAWVNDTDGSVVSDRDLLDLQKPARHETGNYTCIASNSYGEKIKIFSLNVKFTPSVSVMLSNTSDIKERDNVSLSCVVESNPVSDIILYNRTDNKTLDTVKNDNKAEYLFIHSHCLDTGEYMFIVNNSIPDKLHVETATLYIDVNCAPSKISQIPSSGLEGVPLGENYTLQVEILGNPQPIITSRNWSFIDYNGTQHDNLPDNVYTYIQPGTQRLTVIAMLFITNAEKVNYGNYTLNTGNKHGNMPPVTLGVAPKGPPSPPSLPRLLDITAVSMKLSWTAGFNGGLQQTFTVVYRMEGSENEHKDSVNTEPDVNKGDIVIHKLQNEATIKPNTTYNVRIQAENSFEGGSIVYGESAVFTTLVKASFVQDPEITILDGTAEIHFMISGPLTHIIEENCVTDTNICATYNISVPHKAIMMLRNTTTHDFFVEVPLADREATKFVFSFWMYDGEALLYSEADSITVDISGVSIGVIIGIVIAIVLAAAIVTTFIILWKRGIFPKKDSKTDRYARQNPGFSDQEGERQREVGPINGDTYALVAKSGNQNTAKKPTPPKKPSGLKPEPVYVNNGMPESMAGRQTRDQGQRRDLPFTLVGVDGTVYADLQVIGQPSETELIHGIENKVEYIDIGLIKTMNS